MTRLLHLVLLAGMIAPYDSISNERRLATLEEQHINQENYNRVFDRQINEKIDLNERGVREAYQDLIRDQKVQDLKIDGLRDTQNIALFLAGITPLVLGTFLGRFYFNKTRADVKRNEAILAAENRLKSIEAHLVRLDPHSQGD